MTLTSTLPRRSTPPYLPNKLDYKPTHPESFLIQFADEGEFNSCLKTQRVSLGPRFSEALVVARTAKL